MTVERQVSQILSHLKARVNHFNGTMNGKAPQVSLEDNPKARDGV
jgi:hypothetical protein